MLDERLAELQKDNDERALLNHTNVRELTQKMHETLNPGKVLCDENDKLWLNLFIEKNSFK